MFKGMLAGVALALGLASAAVAQSPADKIGRAHV